MALIEVNDEKKIKSGTAGKNHEGFCDLEPVVIINEDNANSGGLKEVVVIDTEGRKRFVIIGDGKNDPPVIPVNKKSVVIDKAKGKGLFPCPDCDYKATWKKSLRRHILVIHKKHRPFCCQLCDYTASEKIILDRHVSNAHGTGSAKQYKCDECDYSAAEKGKLKRHTMSVHRGIKPFKCDQCSFSAVDRNRLQRHILSVHIGVKPHRCPHCDHSTSERGNLKTHILSVHMAYKPYVCHICNYTSGEKGSLNRHLRRVHRQPAATKTSKNHTEIIT